jgi:two-component sensor histidine kinase
MRGMSNRRRRSWWQLSPGSVEAYAFAVILVVIAALLRGGFGFLTQDLQAFTTFYPAVLFAALVGGAGPGILAVILGGLICWWEFLVPYTSLLPLSRADEINLLTYFGASILIVLATDHYRKLTKQLRDEEAFRALAVDELAHRLKNKVATILAIVDFRLRRHPELREEIIASLAALMATDDLINQAQGEGADIHDILSTEFAPYHPSRIATSGPNCFLSPKLAVTIALLVHELATNAAKYGALSNSTGKLTVHWSLSDGWLNLRWQESGGPSVSQPTHAGFGSRLFRRALEPFAGNVDATFAPTGLVCKLSLALPGPRSGAQVVRRAQDASAAE